MSISSDEFYSSVSGLALALHNWGIAPGDRVAILAENRPEWAFADFAVMLLGAVVVPIYTTLTDQQTLELLRDSACRAIFLSTSEQLNKVLAIRDQSPLEHIAVMDAIQTAQASPVRRLIQMRSEDWHHELERRANAV